MIAANRYLREQYLPAFAGAVHSRWAAVWREDEKSRVTVRRRQNRTLHLL